MFCDSGHPDNPPLIVHTVDDQAAVGHGHRRNRVEDIPRNAAFEVEHFVFDLPEQVTEGLRRQTLGEVVEIGDGSHGEIKILLSLMKNNAFSDSAAKILLS